MNALTIVEVIEMNHVLECVLLDLRERERDGETERECVFFFCMKQEWVLFVGSLCLIFVIHDLWCAV